MFSDHPGQQRIARNEYEIVDAGGRIIEEPEWESEVTPGARISMGIVIPIPTRRPTIAGPLATACPRCNTGNPGAVSVRGVINWFVSLRCWGVSGLPAVLTTIISFGLHMCGLANQSIKLC